MKQCPFCNSADNQLTPLNEGQIWFVHCFYCGINGPTARSESWAVRKWDDRNHKQQMIKSVKCTCDACPSQFDVELTSGEWWYVRYRWGVLSVSKYNTNPSEDRLEMGKPFYSEELGGTLDGVMTWDEIESCLKDAGVLE